MAKRSAQGAGTIRQRKDGRWEARYTVGRDSGTGKQIQKSLYGDTQKEVLQKLQQVQTDITNGSHVEPSKLTISAWLDIWVKEYTGNVKERTRREYSGQIQYRIKPSLGAVKLSMLKTHQIQAFYNEALRGTKDKKPLSPKSIKNLHGVIHKALSQAVEIGYLRINPAEACKLPRSEKTEIKPLDEMQIAAFLQAIAGHQFETLYMLTLFSGMRQGEVLGLPWRCVDFKDGTILIDQQLQLIGGQYKVVAVKNDKMRKITPAPAIMQLLHERKGKQAADQLRAGSAWSNQWSLVFTNEIGGNLARQTVYGNYKRIVKKLGLDESRFHDLRHTFAVASLQSGDDVKTVQSNLGHHSAAFTLDQYGHVTEKMKRESADRMEQFIKSVKSL